MLAFPVSGAVDLATPKVVSGGVAVDVTKLTDSDLESFLELQKTGGEPPALTYEYPFAQTVQSVTMFLPGATSMFGGASVAPRLESSDDGQTWRPVADVPSYTIPTTVSFAPVTATWFRVIFPASAPSLPNMGAPAPGADLGPVMAMAAGSAGGKALKVGQLILSPQPAIDRFEAKAGYELVPDYYALSQGVPDTGGVALAWVIDLTSRMRPDGTLDWTPPKGRWKVLRLGYSLLGTTNHPASPEATGLEVDKFDGAAVRRYAEYYIGMYKDAAGSDMVGQHGVRAMVTDSIEVGAANWTPRMIEQFRQLRGYDPTPWLPALTGVIIGERAQSDKFLYDYRRTLADLMASEHYAMMAKVAHEHGIKVYGEALESERFVLGDDMAMRSHTDVPMAAMWTFDRARGPSPAHIADIRGAASVAHIYGQNLVAAESMTSLMAPWAFGPNDLKHVIDMEFVTGVNRPVIHTSVHVPVDDKKPGLSLSIFGQYFNRNESWTALARPWVDYIARNSLMLQQGRNVADLAYFYGEEAPLISLYGEKPVADAPRTHAYDFVNFDALMNALSNEGSELVTPGGARYKALYLGGTSHKMTLAALRRIAALVEGGATVIGSKPIGDPGLLGDPAEFAALTARLWPGGSVTQVGKGRVIVAADAETGLALVGVAPDFHFTGGTDGASIPFLHRKLDDGDSYFLLNGKNLSETIDAHFRVTGKAPELWHAETGTAEPVSYRIENGETIVPLTLASEESVHVVFRKPAAAPGKTVSAQPLVKLAKLSGAWSVAFEAGRGAPPSATFDRLAPLDQNADPAIKYFSGIATYSRDFTAPRGWKPGQPLVLDLGEAKEVAEVRVNGKLAGYAWHAPYQVDIGHAVTPGRNRLQIRVANLWVNRLIGDRQKDAKPVTWTALPSYTAKAPLRRSGLIGPVTMLGK